MNNNQQNNYELRAKSQIVRKDGKEVIFEVMDNGFSIDRVTLNFQKYDKNAPAGQKVKDRISIYIGFPQMLRIINDFAVTGRGYQRLRAEQAEAQKNGQRYWGFQIAMGGTSAEALSRQNRTRQDGKPEFRSLSVMPSYKGNGIALSASSGPGKVTQTGGYTSDGKPDATIQLALSYDDFLEVLLITKAAIEAYLSYKYATEYPKIQEEYRQLGRQRYNNQNNNYQQNQQNRNNYQQVSQPQNQPVNPPTPPAADYNDFVDAFDGGPMGASSGNPIVY